MVIDQERGTGRTTRQMEAAPHGAIFISANHSTMRCDIELSRRIGRSDLRIVRPDWLTDRRWMGLWLPGIVIDHATKLNEEQRFFLTAALTRVRHVDSDGRECD